MENQQVVTTADSSQRKKYSSPYLQKYGSLQALTQNGTRPHKNDSTAATGCGGSGTNMYDAGC